ncbi:MAG TPA: hypothetical protein HA283_06295 [Nanoarchaeota archaeon]|nr:hypothetical protein [Nanoarchaeota archaeon]HIH63882.1 hypothetical protein [Nanoarchaeota archaeon]HIJ09781.1 hypothetical protein [Nanoarchaeota archaeon]
MQKFKLTTPVLFMVFNRLDTTKQVFGEIKKAKPQKLFIACDGPRNTEEKKKTDAVRSYILKNISWKCEVKTLFREKNLGCKYAVAGAIDWFFENVEQGIILEDDCLPSQSFFRFCQEMLEKYSDNPEIMHISGTNIEIKSKIKEDYFFSNVFNVWGWATWKRVWKKYDVGMKGWPQYRWTFFKFLRKYPLFNKINTLRIYELTYSNKINTWDYQWGFACKINNGLAIIPKVNLITNLGFDEGTHTTNYKKNEKTLERFKLDFPLNENKIVEPRVNYLKSYLSFFSNFSLFSFYDFFSYLLKKIFKKLGKF